MMTWKCHSFWLYRPATASGALGVSGARHTRTPETARSPKPDSAGSSGGSRLLYVNPYGTASPDQPDQQQSSGHSQISRQRIQSLSASNASINWWAFHDSFPPSLRIIIWYINSQSSSRTTQFQCHTRTGTTVVCLAWIIFVAGLVLLKAKDIHSYTPSLFSAFLA